MRSGGQWRCEGEAGAEYERSQSLRRLFERTLACLALIPGLLASAPHAHAASSTLLYTQPPCAPVYTAPSNQSLLITQLLGGTDVTATGEGDVSGWTHAHLERHRR